MASPYAVKKYLAYWFQVGKKLIISDQNRAIIPLKVIEGDRFSGEFEEYWQLVTNSNTGDCYLEGTNYTIMELLSPKWEITDCPRCEMPIPMVEVGIQNTSCVCNDLDNWPNNELPSPREPINNQQRLNKIRESLTQKNKSSLKNTSIKAKNPPTSNQQDQINYLHQLTIRQIKNNNTQIFDQSDYGMIKNTAGQNAMGNE